MASILLLFCSVCPGIQEVFPEKYAVLVSPESIVPGQTFRVLVAAEKPFTKASIKSLGPSGSLTALSQQKGGGPPYWWTAEFEAVEVGVHKVWLEHETSRLTEKSFSVSTNKQGRDPGPYIWQAERSWTRQFENLYAAWIEKLFMDKEEGLSWAFLHHVLRDSESNLLFDHLGLNEDNALILDPDCADNPFFFRAYFAWKLGLPYGHHICDRGNAQRAPRCGQWLSLIHI